MSQDLVHIHYSMNTFFFLLSHWKCSTYSALLMRNLNYVNFTINCYIKNCVAGERLVGTWQRPQKELLWQKEICHLPFLFLHTLTGKLTWLAHDSPGYLSTLSPSPTKLTLFLKTLDTSPNPIPQASSSRPWQSRWLMADGTM